MADAESYLRAASLTVLDVEFWVGVRPFTVPLAYKFLGGNPETIHLAQTGLSIVAWILLAAAVAAAVRSVAIRIAAFTLVLVLGASKDVVLWDALVLSESISLSLFALLVACVLWALRGGGGRWAVFACFALLWAFSRDSNALVVLACAALFGAAAALPRLRARARQDRALMACALALIFAASHISADIGLRWVYPLTNVILARILPNGSRTEYFVARGMPLDAELVEHAALPVPKSTEEVRRDPRCNSFRRWLERDGKRVYLSFLLSHPGVTLDEAFCNKGRLLTPWISAYHYPRGLPQFTHPRVDNAIFVWRLDVLAVWAGVLALAAVAIHVRAGVGREWLVPAFLIVSALPLSVAVWHGDAIEIERHSLQTGVQLRVGLWVLTAFVVDRLVEALRRALVRVRRGETAAAPVDGVSQEPALGTPLVVPQSGASESEMLKWSLAEPLATHRRPWPSRVVRATAGFSLANLWCIGAWQAQAHLAFYGYHDTSGGWHQLAALSLIVVCAWAGAILLLRAACEVTTPAIHATAQVLLLLSSVVPINSLVGQIARRQRRFRRCTGSPVDHRVGSASRAVRALRHALVPRARDRYRQGRAADSRSVRSGDRAQFRATRCAVRRAGSAGARASTAFCAGASATARLFDELDYRLPFESRSASLQLRNFDRFREESLFATRAYAPSDGKMLSVPALLTGRFVDTATPRGPADLQITLDDGSELSLAAAETIFSQARELVRASAAVGWFHPYSRVFSRDLTSAYWICLCVGNERPSSLRASLRRQVRGVVSAVPFASELGFVTPEAPYRARHLRDYRELLRRALQVAADPTFDVVFIHLTVPHPPAIYYRARDVLTDRPGGNYLDNLALADRSLGELRAAMEASGVLDDTAVLVSSDHEWRPDGWRPFYSRDEWAPEDAPVDLDTQDARIPFLLRLPGQRTSLHYEAVLNTVLSKDLLLAVLRGELVSLDAVRAWLDTRRSMGLSPYRERARSRAVS